MSVCDDPLVIERLNAIASAHGYWAVIRKIKRDQPPRTQRYKDEASARAAWGKLDVIEGWATLVNQHGGVVEMRSGCVRR